MDQMEGDKDEELENLKNRIHILETEVSTARFEAMRFKSESERYQLDKLRSEDKISNYDDKIQSLHEELETLKLSTKSELNSLKKERDEANQILDDLHQEVDCLRSQSHVQGSSVDLLSSYREVQELVKRLTSENKVLREQLEETQMELFSRSLEEGRSLIRPPEVNIAVEMNTYTKDELMDILVKEKDANFKLRDYIEHIIVRIIDKKPSILEIGSEPLE